MASSINASTTAGVVTTADTSGVLNIQTAGTTAIAIDASQAVTFTNGANLPNTFGFKNRIINGAMVIDQRNAGASTTITNATDFFITDRFKFYRDVGGTLTGQQSTTAPTGFVNSLLLTATSGVSPSAAQLNFFQQIIEGLNVGDLGWGTASAQTVTLSFWVRSSVTGTYSISLSNSALNRAYVATYTINAANTFEQKTITIAGDTSGTWLTTNGVGLRVYFDLGSGSNYNLTANAWGGTFGTRTSGSVSWFATTSATFYITGVQLEKGATATSFDYRDYGRELALCQRYLPAYTLIAGQNIVAAGMAYNSTTCIIPIFFPVSARVYPTGVTYTGTATDVQVVTGSTIINCTAFNFNSGSSNTTGALNMIVASITTGVSVLLVTPASTSGTFYFTGCEL